MAKNCEKDLFEIAKKAFGNEITPEVISNYLRDFRQRAKRLQNKENMTEEVSYRTAAAQLIEARKLAAEDYKVAAQRTTLKMLNFVSMIKANVKKPWAKTLHELTGTISAAQSYRLKQLMGGLNNALKKEGDDVIRAAQLDSNAIRLTEMLQAREFDDTPLGKAARLISTWQREKIPEMARELGLSFHELEGWAYRQIHDDEKILRGKGSLLSKIWTGKVDKDQRKRLIAKEWVDYIYPRLDHGMSFPDLPVNKDGSVDEAAAKNKLMLDWEARHKRAYSQYTSDLEGDYIKKSSFANSLTGKQRSYHFRDAQATYEYQKEYGAGGTWEAIQSGLMQTAKTFAVADKFGPQPDLAYSMMKKYIEKDRDQMMLHNTQKLLNDSERVIKYSMGYFSKPADSSIPALANSWSLMENLTKMGDLLKKVTGQDLATVHAVEQIRGGASGWEAAKSVGNIVKAFVLGDSDEIKDITEALGVMRDSTITGTMNPHELLADRFSIDAPANGKLSHANALMFKWNGVKRWDNKAVASSLARALSNRLARKRALSWKDMPPGLKQHMEMYQLSEPEWNLLRKQSTRMADNKSYITGDCMEKATKEQVADYLQEKGIMDKSDAGSLSDDDYNYWRRDIDSNLTQMTSDYGHYVITHPDIFSVSKRAEQMHTQSGWVWAVQHLALQYKGYDWAYTQKVIGMIVKSGAPKRVIAYHLLALGLRTVAYSALSYTLINSLEGTAVPHLNIFSDNKDEREKAQETIERWLLPAGGAWLDNMYSFVKNPIRATASLMGPTVNDIGSFVDYLKHLVSTSHLSDEERQRKNNVFTTLQFATGNTPFHTLPIMLAAWHFIIQDGLLGLISPQELNAQRASADRRGDFTPFKNLGEQ